MCSGAITLAKMIPVMSQVATAECSSRRVGQEITHLDLSGNHLTDCAAGEVAEAFLSQATSRRRA